MITKTESRSPGTENDFIKNLISDLKDKKKTDYPFEDYSYAFFPYYHADEVEFRGDYSAFIDFQNRKPYRDISAADIKKYNRFQKEQFKILNLIAREPLSIECIAVETGINLVRVIHHIHDMYLNFQNISGMSDEERKACNIQWVPHPIAWYYSICLSVKKVVAHWYIPEVGDYTRTIPKNFILHGPTPINKPMN